MCVCVLRGCKCVEVDVIHLDSSDALASDLRLLR